MTDNLSRPRMPTDRAAMRPDGLPRVGARRPVRRRLGPQRGVPPATRIVKDTGP
ncbi:hypothetical protein WYO_3392 [Methylobacterium sp. GXF4]|nr:hypothetical protein WYO_3392 [Methylobacterium sp. GXF4]